MKHFWKVNPNPNRETYNKLEIPAAETNRFNNYKAIIRLHGEYGGIENTPSGTPSLITIYGRRLDDPLRYEVVSYLFTPSSDIEQLKLIADRMIELLPDRSNGLFLEESCSDIDLDEGDVVINLNQDKGFGDVGVVVRASPVLDVLFFEKLIIISEDLEDDLVKGLMIMDPKTVSVNRFLLDSKCNFGLAMRATKKTKDAIVKFRR